MLFTFLRLSTHPSNPAKQILQLMGSFLYFIYPTQFVNSLEKIFWNREFPMQNYRSSQAWRFDTCETIFVPGAICSTNHSCPSWPQHALFISSHWTWLWQEQSLLFAIGLLLLLFLENCCSAQEGNPTVAWEAQVGFILHPANLHHSSSFGLSKGL